MSKKVFCSLRRIALGIKIVYDQDLVKETFGDKTEKEYEKLIWKDIKEINKKLPVFKKIKEVTPNQFRQQSRAIKMWKY